MICLNLSKLWTNYCWSLFSWTPYMFLYCIQSHCIVLHEKQWINEWMSEWMIERFIVQHYTLILNYFVHNHIYNHFPGWPGLSDGPQRSSWKYMDTAGVVHLTGRMPMLTLNQRYQNAWSLLIHIVTTAPTKIQFFMITREHVFTHLLWEMCGSVFSKT